MTNEENGILKHKDIILVYTSIIGNIFGFISLIISSILLYLEITKK